MYNYIYLVGGLEHEFYDFPCIGNDNPKGLKPPTRYIHTCTSGYLIGYNLLNVNPRLNPGAVQMSSLFGGTPDP